MSKSAQWGAVCAALLAVSAAAPALAHDKHHHHKHSHNVTYNTVQITVACYRGPWEQVYWDRGLPAFYDSLTRAGYSPERAQAIADRVCRDQTLVGNTEALRREASRIIREAPRR